MTDYINSLAVAPDARILEAWENRKAAYARYNALPFSDKPGDTPEEDACWLVIDQAEEVIRASIATTPAGIAAQVWAALYHSTSGTNVEDAAITRGDLDYFETEDRRVDWNVRMLVAALRSLQAMEARHG